jgi:hypothetical protein
MQPFSIAAQSNPYQKAFSNDTQPKFKSNPTTTSNAQQPPPNRYQNEHYHDLQDSNISYGATFLPTASLNNHIAESASHDLSQDEEPEVRGVRWCNVDTRDIPANNRGRRVPSRGDEERRGDGSGERRKRGNEWGGGRSDTGSEREEERETREEERETWRDDRGSEEGNERRRRRVGRGNEGGGGGRKGDGGDEGRGEGNWRNEDRRGGNGERRTGSDGQGHGSSGRDTAEDDQQGMSLITRGSSQASGTNSIMGTATPLGTDDVINDDLVRRTRRQFKQDWFHERQQPYEILGS